MTVLGWEAIPHRRAPQASLWPSSLFAQCPRTVHQLLRDGQTALPRKQTAARAATLTDNRPSGDIRRGCRTC